jgi:hypothetical protein
MTSTVIKVPKLRFSEPRRNLSNKSSRKNTERDFTLNFARSYISQIEALHHGATRTKVDFAREIPINGFGIADLVMVFQNPKKPKFRDCMSDNANSPQVTEYIIRAFELKMADWRRALIQAHRYRYFADAVIVVLPIEKLKIASNYSNTFKSIKVGLWGFDPLKKQIITLYTPRPSNPLEPKYKPRAIKLVSQASKSQQFA